MHIGVVLNGCGHRDGSEIHEAVLTLLALAEEGARVSCFAPDAAQELVVDHLSGKKITEPRNMLHEAARLARGKIAPLNAVAARDLDAIVIPGGFGTAYNLCTFAEKGPAMTVRSDLEQLLVEMHRLGRTIGAICIAPVIIAKVFGKLGPTITLGSAENDAAKVAVEFGATVVSCPSTDCVVDQKLKIVTAPAYMHEVGIAEVAGGIRKLAKAVVRG